MRSNILKFIIFMVIHILLFYYIMIFDGILFAKVFSVVDTDVILIILFHGFFSLIYFIIIWKDLYSFSYHYFINQGIEVILRRIIATILFAFIFLGMLILLRIDTVIGDSSSHCVEKAALIIFMDTTIYLFVFIIQLVWVQGLVRINFLGKKIVLLGNPDERIPIHQLLDSTSKSRIYSGRIIQRDARWFFRDRDGDESEIRFEHVIDLLCSIQAGELIIFLGNNLQKESVYEIVKHCREMEIGYYIVADVERLPKHSFWDKSFPYIPIIESFLSKSDSLVLVSLKRLLDLLIVCILSFLLVPLMCVIGLFIKLEDGGPVFYNGFRIGRNGKQIKFYKFRTMVPEANSYKHILLRFNERVDGPLFKMTNDPRLTHIGKIIRRYNIDELPQLINVLKGDLSLVGPRPHLAEEIHQYAPRELIRLESIPGITCFPQIYNNYRMGFREWMQLDLKYRQRWSVSLDIKILASLFQTLFIPRFIRK